VEELLGSCKGQREREQQKLDSTPKADFCRSRKCRIHKALAWAHTTVAKCVGKMLSQQKNLIS